MWVKYIPFTGTCRKHRLRNTPEKTRAPVSRVSVCRFMDINFAGGVGPSKERRHSGRHHGSVVLHGKGLGWCVGLNALNHINTVTHTPGNSVENDSIK